MQFPRQHKSLCSFIRRCECDALPYTLNRRRLFISRLMHRLPAAAHQIFMCELRAHENDIDDDDDDDDAARDKWMHILLADCWDFLINYSTR